MIDNKIEIGFDLSGQPGAQFATLNDATLGVLDSEVCILGGALFQDVTPDVIKYQIGRGKSRQLDRYGAGRTTIQLDNNARLYDPLYSASPYNGQIIPKREVRITSNDKVQIYSLIDDWNLDYSPNGNSFATIIASDAFTQFANQTLVGGTATAQYTGERIAAILTNAGVQWPNTDVSVETGKQFLQADVISDGTNALQYLQTIADSEPGDLFLSREGDVVFKDRVPQTVGTPVTFADDDSGIPYQEIEVVYGAELLFNEVTVGRLNGGQFTKVDLESEEEYGIQSLSRTGLPLDNDTSAENLATYLVSQYAQPEYRFESITIDLTELSVADANKVLDLELTNEVRVKFTPNNLPPAIDRYATIIGINQDVNQTQHRVTLNLATTEHRFWQLSDLVYGRLSSGNALAYS